MVSTCKSCEQQLVQALPISTNNMVPLLIERSSWLVSNFQSDDGPNFKVTMFGKIFEKPTITNFQSQTAQRSHPLTIMKVLSVAF